MKVAYLAGDLKGSTGYSYAAQANILALDYVGVEVVPCNIKMSQSEGEVPQRIKELEKKSLNDIDVVIQHNLPSEFVYKGGVHNIGAFHYETDKICNTWPQNINLMDKVMVSSEFCAEACKNSGVEKPIFLCRHSVDTQKYYRDYPTIDFDIPSNCVKFYTIAENNRRKNLPATLAAFLSEFSYADNVVLVIKTSGGNETKEYLKGMVEDLKQRICKFNVKNYFPNIIVISDNLKEDQIYSIHKSCNVFISTSYGEAICIPFIDAMGFGNKTIVPNHSAFKEYRSPNTVMIDSFETNAFDNAKNPHYIYTAEEKWWGVSTSDLSKKMRQAYELNSFRNAAENRFVCENFGREKIGLQIKGIINA